MRMSHPPGQRFAGPSRYDGSAGGPGSAVAPFPERKGWEVTRELTTPLQQGNNLSQLQFGELLGAGSFGRVYKAEWAGRQLAVKVKTRIGAHCCCLDTVCCFQGCS